jgi:hypothetical protein
LIITCLTLIDNADEVFIEYRYAQLS